MIRLSKITGNKLRVKGRAPVLIGLVVLSISIIFPLFFILMTSLKNNVDYSRDPFGLPDTLMLENYSSLLDNFNIGRAFLNSLFVCTITVALVLLIAGMAGYALAKLSVPGGRFITGTFLGVMLFPGPVLIIPIYVLLARLGLIGDVKGLILVYVASGIPFATFFLTLVFKSIPKEITEAAQIDGAGFFRTLRSIIAPLGASGVITLAIMQFLGAWNELLFAFMILPSETSRLLTPTLATIGTRYVSDQPLVSAGLFISASLPLIILMFASKYIIEGLQVTIKKN